MQLVNFNRGGEKCLCNVENPGTMSLSSLPSRLKNRYYNRMHYHQRYILQSRVIFAKCRINVKTCTSTTQRQNTSHLTLHVIFRGCESGFIKNSYVICNRYRCNTPYKFLHTLTNKLTRIERDLIRHYEFTADAIIILFASTKNTNNERSCH